MNVRLNHQEYLQYLELRHAVSTLSTDKEFFLRDIIPNCVIPRVARYFFENLKHLPTKVEFVGRDNNVAKYVIN